MTAQSEPGAGRGTAGPAVRIFNWVVSDPKILAGKPCVRGTRLSVEFLLELAAGGATPRRILAAYPQLTAKGLAAAFLYAVHVLKQEQSSSGRRARTGAARRTGLRGWGSLERFARGIDAAFSSEVRDRSNPQRPAVRLLLDTQIALWWLAGSPRLPRRFRDEM